MAANITVDDKTVKMKTFDYDMEYICQVAIPDWACERITFQKLSGGTQCELYHCCVRRDKRSLVIRLDLKSTENSTVRRHREILGIQLAASAGVTQPLLVVFNNGLVYGYVKGTTPSWGILWEDTLARKLMQMLAKLHHVDATKVEIVSPIGHIITVEPEFRVFKALKTVVSRIPDNFQHYPLRQKRIEKIGWNKKRLLDEIEAVECHLASFNFPIVFSHNDCWLSNIVFDENERTFGLIDFEFADFNYEAFDLAVLLNCIEELDTFHKLLPDGFVKPTEAELRQPRGEEYKKKLALFYMAEKCSLQGKMPTDFTDDELEKFYMQAQMLNIVVYLVWAVFNLRNLDDPSFSCDTTQFCELTLQKFDNLKEKLYSFKP